MDMLRTRSNETIYSCRCSFHDCCCYFNTFDCCYCFERSLMCLSYSERDFDIVVIRNVSCSRLMICESKIAFIRSEKVLEALNRVLTLPNHTSRRVLLKSSRFVDLSAFGVELVIRISSGFVEGCFCLRRRVQVRRTQSERTATLGVPENSIQWSTR